MNLTTKGRYAVMSMVDLSMQSGQKPVVLADIASRQNIAVSYLEQIFMKLRKASLVKSIRGPGGGYILARPMEKIAISEIVKAVDESIKMTRCDKSKGCAINNSKCVTHHLWQGLGNTIYQYLNSISLGDVCMDNLNNVVELEPIEAISN